MKQTRHLLAKAICWQLIGLISMSVVGYGFTGSIAVGGVMALVNGLVGFVLYIVFERVWERRGGRIAP